MKRPRSAGALIVSVALHVLIGAALIWVLSVPAPLQQWLRGWQRANPPVEHIGFIAIPNRGVNTPGQNGGNNKPVTRERPEPRLVAPTTIPTGIPPVPSSRPPKREAGTGTGPVVGTGGMTRGIVPSFSDKRLWLPPGPVMTAPKTPSQRLDSALAARLRVHEDSLDALAAAAGKAPGDWTFEKNGKKYGVDPKWIHLGKFSIPTAILALLPITGGSNPTAVREERALNLQRTDIMYQAQRAMNDEEFREAVKRIRERKQREHDAEVAEQEKSKKPAPTDAGQGQVVHP